MFIWGGQRHNSILLLIVKSFLPHPQPAKFAYFICLFFCLSSLNHQHRVELLPACEDNYALCSELIPMSRPLLISLHHSCSHHVHLQLSLITKPLQATAVNFVSTWVHASCGFTNVLCLYTGHVCILNDFGMHVNPWPPCLHNWHHCGRLPGEHSITIPTSM